MLSNVVFIGRKPILNYCMAIIQTLNKNDIAKVKARGYAISRAVDAVEVTRNRYLEGLNIKSIEIGTEELTTTYGDTRNVSNITIILEQKDV
jgi:DNA-binding protein